MARKILTNIDMTKNQVLNVVVQVLATAPADPVLGQIYYDSVDLELKQFNGTEWVGLASNCLPLSGGTMTGDIHMGNHIIDGLPDATADTQAATFKQLKDVEAKVTKAIVVKGVKATVADLPTTGNEIGDMWLVSEDASEYIWVNAGTEEAPDLKWEKLGFTIDLSNYVTFDDVVSAYGDAENKAISQDFFTRLASKITLREISLPAGNTSLTIDAPKDSDNQLDFLFKGAYDSVTGEELMVGVGYTETADEITMNISIDKAYANSIKILYYLINNTAEL